jgi:hypothetical protein
VPAPLIDNAPGPVQGRPVSGFVPVVLDKSPVGIDGEMLSSVRAGRSVLLPAEHWIDSIPTQRRIAGVLRERRSSAQNDEADADQSNAICNHGRFPPESR